MGVGLGKKFPPLSSVWKGFVKMEDLSQSNSKFRYYYLQTPGGIAENSKLAVKFLKQKFAEYDLVHVETDVLKSQLAFEACAKERRQNPEGSDC